MRRRPALSAALLLLPLLLVASLPAAMSLLSLLLAADPTTHAEASMRVRRGGECNLDGLNDVRFQFNCGPFFSSTRSLMSSPSDRAARHRGRRKHRGAANIVLGIISISTAV